MEKPNNPDSENISPRSRLSLRRRPAPMSRHEAETLQVLAFVDAGRSGLAALVAIIHSLALPVSIVAGGLLIDSSHLPARAVYSLIGPL